MTKLAVPKIKADADRQFGDFQTPVDLAREICDLLQRKGVCPAAVVEPTCGRGNILFTALDTFDSVKQAIGTDVSPQYVASAVDELSTRSYSGHVTIREANFFDEDWEKLISPLPDPLLVIGNPPWVTNSEIGALGGSNLPTKYNFQNHSGFDALTGKSNFDISEWMLVRLLHWLHGRSGCMAMLCKTSVARKLISHAHNLHLNIDHAAIFHIDAIKHFNAGVNACLFFCRFTPGVYCYDCDVHDSLYSVYPQRTIGYRDGELVSALSLYEQWKHLIGQGGQRWRSGVKHDCSKVMELVRTGDLYRNGLGEMVDLEETFLYPMLKTSEVAKQGAVPNKLMLVTQSTVGEDTRGISIIAPKTWKYLEAHGHLLDRRGSSIYRASPRFSVFGVGPYTFAPWKVAISGFYKSLSFRVVGHENSKPVVLDDSSYSLSFETEAQAQFASDILNSEPAQGLLNSLVFWDSKRPVTVDLLRKIDLNKCAKELGVDAQKVALLIAAASPLEAQGCLSI